MKRIVVLLVFVLLAGCIAPSEECVAIEENVKLTLGEGFEYASGSPVDRDNTGISGSCLFQRTGGTGPNEVAIAYMRESTLAGEDVGVMKEEIMSLDVYKDSSEREFTENGYVYAYLIEERTEGVVDIHIQHVVLRKEGDFVSVSFITSDESEFYPESKLYDLAIQVSDGLRE
ncbi:MAG: hypothetical protein GY852_01865 [bacterium]|nr:hypothetical protein [bacterium]